MTEADTDNMRSMMQMRDRSPVENAAYAMGCLSDADQDAAIAMFNDIWGSPDCVHQTRISVVRAKRGTTPALATC